MPTARGPMSRLLAGIVDFSDARLYLPLMTLVMLLRNPGLIATTAPHLHVLGTLSLLSAPTRFEALLREARRCGLLVRIAEEAELLEDWRAIRGYLADSAIRPLGRLLVVAGAGLPLAMRTKKRGGTVGILGYLVVSQSVLDRATADDLLPLHEACEAIRTALDAVMEPQRQRHARGANAQIWPLRQVAVLAHAQGLVVEPPLAPSPAASPAASPAPSADVPDTDASTLPAARTASGRRRRSIPLSRRTRVS